MSNPGSDHQEHAILEKEASFSLVQIIQDYLAITIDEPPIGALICIDCLKTIREWHFFREKCLENERLCLKREIKYEVLFTSDVPGIAQNTVCTTLNVIPQQQTNLDEIPIIECKDTEEKEDYNSESAATEIETRPLAKKECFTNKRSDSRNSNRKSGKKISSRQRIAAESTHGLEIKKRQGRSKLRNNKSDGQTSNPISPKSEKQRIVPKICAVCGMARTDMAAHMRWHNNERPYQCPHCPRAFSNCSNLKNHINLHTREKMYKCDLCDKEFPSSTARGKHRETHATINAHQCAICGKTFKYTASWARHKIIHTAEPKVKCTFCEMVFLTKTRLRKHLLVHTDSKPFVCGICNRPFNRKDNLKVHMKTHLKTSGSNTKKDQQENSLVEVGSKECSNADTKEQFISNSPSIKR
ncbi:zinc finger protein 679-like [Anopheles ziemanni]|uniref:zinc finger protein 679-like n=1 Tax=Anopheles ziemanni TaxID=345580 RepID=UPI0026604EBA|nr:zinc finger protein 679-like [Anopheles ziemanni]